MDLNCDAIAIQTPPHFKRNCASRHSINNKDMELDHSDGTLRHNTNKEDMELKRAPMPRYTGR
ncbi:uncharacterized protein N7473_000096 [Penicillium subrubescens]|uniref:uncharacterized protein n=1 Tax=Penicillium subrubescens TaxID=1316194 RepID=UPI002545B65F|nr:uncharacterized protein N7473_000096 [Penicillium subrubescens]KAJ5910793.1 hypothetical protein N7473_000096 [Penicillium subrubescens]